MGHFARLGVDMERLIDEMHARIRHIDVKDADAVIEVIELFVQDECNVH